MKNAKKMMLALTLTTAAAVTPVAGAFPFHHKSATTTTHRNFIQRHPVISAVAGGALLHHFLKPRH